MLQNNTPTLVVGFVTYYDHNRKYGFAQGYSFSDPDTGRPHRIFIHADGCRQMGGKMSAPELSTTPMPVPDSWGDPAFLRGADVQLVMQVVRSPKGFKAVAWGIVPKRTIYTDLNEVGGLESFIGGELYIFGRNGAQMWSIQGWIASARLVHGQFEFELTDGYENHAWYNKRYLLVKGREMHSTLPQDGSYVLRYITAEGRMETSNRMTLTKPQS
jgi:hypothetical protein